jgi:hypothetical protein
MPPPGRTGWASLTPAKDQQYRPQTLAQRADFLSVEPAARQRNGALPSV